MSWINPVRQFEGNRVLPVELSSELVRKIMIDDPPLSTYGRLMEPVLKEAPP